MKTLPTLRQLRYLVTVAETHHFGRAAELCAVTQSTLSAGIQELETLLGTRLIERRSRRQVVFTPLGEEIVERARALLADGEALVDAAQAGAQPLVGDLRLGVIPTIGPYIMPRLVRKVREEYPELKLFLREEQSATLMDMLNSGRLDAVLMALPYAVGELPRVEVGNEDVVLALPYGHPLAALDAVPMDRLDRETMLMLEDGHCLRDHAMEACHLARSRGNETFQATGLSTLIQMVAGGIGLTLVPRIAVPVEARPGSGVTVRPIRGARTARSLALFWRPASPRARDYRLLAGVIEGVTREILTEADDVLADLLKPAA